MLCLITTSRDKERLKTRGTQELARRELEKEMLMSRHWMSSMTTASSLISISC